MDGWSLLCVCVCIRCLYTLCMSGQKTNGEVQSEAMTGRAVRRGMSERWKQFNTEIPFWGGKKHKTCCVDLCGDHMWVVRVTWVAVWMGVKLPWAGSQHWIVSGWWVVLWTTSYCWWPFYDRRGETCSRSHSESSLASCCTWSGWLRNSAHTRAESEGGWTF